MMFTKNETLKLKGIAILLLLFHHLFYSPKYMNQNGLHTYLLSTGMLSELGIAARSCVWIFVFLSAYGLSISYSKKKMSTGRFIGKHWLSLMKYFWPVYFLVFAMACFSETDVKVLYEGSLLNLGIDFMGLSDLLGTPTLIGAWWYMSFAMVLIVAIPMLNILYDKYDNASVALVFVLLFFLPDGIISKHGGRYLEYALTACMGTCMARGNWFDRLLKKTMSKFNEGLEFICLHAAILYILYLNYGKLTEDSSWQLASLLNGIAVVLLCTVVAKYYTNKVLTRVLTFLGKQSAIIFMVHVAFYVYESEYVYWTHNTVITYLTLLTFSLITAVLIKKILKITKYEAVYARLN